VARLLNNVWESYGNTAFTGTAGSRGSVVSNNVFAWSTVPDYFALASSEPVSAPLALNDTIQAIRNNTINNNRGHLQLLAVNFSGPQILTCRAFEKIQAAICMLDNSGRVVKVMNTIIERGLNHLPLALPSLPPGVYSLYATTARGASNVLRFVYIK
jgi:hypothetical protein